MARPSKPASVIKLEGKSHRTKAELATREAGEKALLTGVPIKETQAVKKNIRSHQAFLHVRKLMDLIGHNDDLYGNTINRYCLLLAEEEEFQIKREEAFQTACDFRDRQDEILEAEEMKVGEFFKLLSTLEGHVVNLDKQIMAKRKMLLDIEKESVFTVAASLRAIPKTPEKKSNPLLEALKDG